ncbi:MAG: START domain-containing protein [Myxococcota bacterium]|nr:START domain-containing protein [Myxococcota bacterium]
MRLVVAVRFVLVCTLCASVSASWAETAWELVTSDRGVKVWAKDEPGRSLPTFRGLGQVKGNLFHLMAIILDNRRAPQWVDRCASSKQLKRYDARTTLVYSVADSPWPVSDRDTVVRVTTKTVRPGHEYRITMRSQPNLAPKVDGVVRIEQSHIYFHLTKIDAQNTMVEYSLNVDPGGYLPKWIVRLSTRSMPIDTLRALENQVGRTATIYADVIETLRTPPK